MTDHKLSREAAVRLLRAKAHELEGLIGNVPRVPTEYLAADIALIAHLLADHIEQGHGDG